MAEGESFRVDLHYFNGGEFGAEEVLGYAYEGSFGPLHMALLQERTTAVLRGAQVGEARLAWGPEAESTLENPIVTLQRDGVEGNVAGRSFRVWWHPGVRRSKNFIGVDAQGIPARVMRLRRWKTWSLETSDGTQLVALKESWRWSWKGEILAPADADDVAVLLLLATTEMIYKIGTGSVALF